MCDHSPEDCALRFDNVTGRLVCVAHVPPPTPRDPEWKATARDAWNRGRGQIPTEADFDAAKRLAGLEP